MLLIRFISLCSIIFISATYTLCENSASVYQIIPRNDEQLHVLRKLDRKLKDILFWSHPSSVNETVDLLVPEDQYDKFKHLMTENSLTYKVQIPDVQRLLDNSVEPQQKSNIKRYFYPRDQAVNGFGWTRFHNIDEIHNWLDSLATLYPNNASVVVAGYSLENRPIKGVHLKFSEGKKSVFIESGIHAREWIAPATATYLINALLTSTNPEIRQLAESYEWYIFPSVNPDGYFFTHINPRHINYRMWRKTRSKHSVQQCTYFSCQKVDCYGADPNRNWNVFWGGKGSSTNDPCSEIYAGKSAFSEIETKSLANYIGTVAHNLFAYISFHSYGQKLIFPYGHTTEHLDNYNEQYSVGLEAIKGLSKKYGTRYGLGSIGEVMGAASGSSVDWVKATYRVPFAYCYELRGQTSANNVYGFIAPPSEIIPNSEEILDSLVALFRSAGKSSQPVEIYS